MDEFLPAFERRGIRAGLLAAPTWSRLPLAMVVPLIAGCARPPAAVPSPPSPESVAEETTPPPETSVAAGTPRPTSPVPATAARGEPAADAPTAAVAPYTEEQARRGQRAFRQTCSDCHYTSEFRGPVFTNAWARRTARDLYRELRRTMPEDDPGGLPRQTYVDVMAYILELNGYPAGADELPPDDEVLGRVRLTPPVGPSRWR